MHTRSILLLYSTLFSFLGQTHSLPVEGEQSEDSYSKEDTVSTLDSVDSPYRDDAFLSHDSSVTHSRDEPYFYDDSPKYDLPRYGSPELGSWATMYIKEALKELVKNCGPYLHEHFPRGAAELPVNPYINDILRFEEVHRSRSREDNRSLSREEKKKMDEYFEVTRNMYKTLKGPLSGFPPLSKESNLLQAVRDAKTTWNDLTLAFLRQDNRVPKSDKMHNMLSILRQTSVHAILRNLPIFLRKYLGRDPIWEDHSDSTNALGLDRAVAAEEDSKESIPRKRVHWQGSDPDQPSSPA